MKLGILTQYYPPEVGAPQARLSELAQRFVDRGHEVHVLTAMPNYPKGRIYPGYGGWFHRETRDGAEVIRSWIYPTQSVGMARRLANYFSFVGSSAVTGMWAMPRVDYLITESPPLFLGISGYLLSRLKRARWIFNVSDLWPESAVRLGVVHEGLSLEVARKLEAFCYRQAWAVTGQSREILADVEARFPGVRTYHLSNGVDTERFHPGLRSEAVRRDLVDGAQCVALYAGLHGIAQGLEQVLEAAARLPQRTNLRIVMVGEGPEKEALLERAKALGLRNVEFRDSCERELMPSLVASADVALVPLRERLPGAVPSKLYEAMGAGLPVVLVAEGEAADIVRRSNAGVAIQPGDVDGLARALAELADDPEKRARFGAGGREAARRHYDRGDIARRFIDFLEGELAS